MKPINPLTEQKLVVLACLVLGQHNVSGANEISISTRIFEKHLSHFFHKPGASSRIETALDVLNKSLFSDAELSSFTQDM